MICFRQKYCNPKVFAEELDFPRAERGHSRSPNPSRHVAQDETDVLYVVGSTCMTLSAEIPDSPVMSGTSKLSPRGHDTRLVFTNEKSPSPGRNARSFSQSRDADFDVKTRPVGLNHSSRKPRSRVSLSERKGVIMNPKSPGMGFDSRKYPHSNTPSQTSSDEESKALIGATYGKRV